MNDNAVRDEEKNNQCNNCQRSFKTKTGMKRFLIFFGVKVKIKLSFEKRPPDKWEVINHKNSGKGTNFLN